MNRISSSASLNFDLKHTRSSPVEDPLKGLAKHGEKLSNGAALVVLDLAHAAKVAMHHSAGHVRASAPTLLSTTQHITVSGEQLKEFNHDIELDLDMLAHALKVVPPNLKNLRSHVQKLSGYALELKNIPHASSS